MSVHGAGSVSRAAGARQARLFRGTPPSLMPLWRTRSVAPRQGGPRRLSGADIGTSRTGHPRSTTGIDFRRGSLATTAESTPPPKPLSPVRRRATTRRRRIDWLIRAFCADRATPHGSLGSRSWADRPRCRGSLEALATLARVWGTKGRLPRDRAVASDRGAPCCTQCEMRSISALRASEAVRFRRRGRVLLLCFVVVCTSYVVCCFGKRSPCGMPGDRLAGSEAFPRSSSTRRERDPWSSPTIRMRLAPRGCVAEWLDDGRAAPRAGPRPGPRPAPWRCFVADQPRSAGYEQLYTEPVR
jgi:hypothetical protein